MSAQTICIQELTSSTCRQQSTKDLTPVNNSQLTREQQLVNKGTVVSSQGNNSQLTREQQLVQKETIVSPQGNNIQLTRKQQLAHKEPEEKNNRNSSQTCNMEPGTCICPSKNFVYHTALKNIDLYEVEIRWKSESICVQWTHILVSRDWSLTSDINIVFEKLVKLSISHNYIIIYIQVLMKLVRVIQA